MGGTGRGVGSNGRINREKEGGGEDRGEKNVVAASPRGWNGAEGDGRN